MNSTNQQNPVYSKAKIYLQFFYLMGNSPPLSSPPNKSKFKHFLASFPIILCILMTIVSYISGTLLQIQFTFYKNDLVTHMYLVGETVTSFIIFSQYFIHGTALRSVIEHLDFLHNFVQEKFRHKISLQKHLNRIFWQLLYCMYIYIGSMIVYSCVKIFCIHHEDDYLGVLIDLMQLPTILSIMHVVFYIQVCKNFTSTWLIYF